MELDVLPLEFYHITEGLLQGWTPFLEFNIKPAVMFLADDFEVAGLIQVNVWLLVILLLNVVDPRQRIVNEVVGDAHEGVDVVDV